MHAARSGRKAGKRRAKGTTPPFQHDPAFEIVYKACRAHRPRRITTMAKSQQKSNKEVRKPKAEKVKTIAANASTKDNPVAMVTIRK
jgi:hypothetical protein